MEVSERLLKRRIAALLPPLSGDSGKPSNGFKDNDPKLSQTVDVSDLPAIADDERFLQEAYHRILGRECDVSGFVSCMELLKRHVPRRVILLQLINSEESRRKAVRFVGVQENGRTSRRRSSRFSIPNIAGRMGAILRDLIRRILFTRFDSIDHKLEFLLREVTGKSDILVAKTNESFVLLSKKLDDYVVSLSQENLQNREELALQGGRFLEMQQSHHRLDQSLQVARDLLASVDSRASTWERELAEENLQLARSIRLVETELHTLTARLDEATQAFEASLTAAVQDARQDVQAVRDTISANTSMLANEQSRAFAEVLGRIRPPVVSTGADVLVTEVAGVIVAVPAKEWRMAAYHAFRGAMEPGLTKYVSTVIKPGSVLVDVGANVGFYTLLAAKLLQGDGEIYSFEPTPRTFEVFRDNVQVNGLLELGNIHLHQLAVADKSGVAMLSVFDGDCGHNTLFETGQADHKIEVSTISLDEALARVERVDFVKIDAEGAEPLILRGMKDVIERNPEIRIVLEFAPVHLKRAGVIPSEFLEQIAEARLAIRRIDDVTGELLNVTSEELSEAFSLNLLLDRRRPTVEGQ